MEGFFFQLNTYWNLIQNFFFNRLSNILRHFIEDFYAIIVCSFLVNCNGGARYQRRFNDAGKHKRFRTKFTAWAYWHITKSVIHTPLPVTDLIWRRRLNTPALRIKILFGACSLLFCRLLMLQAFDWLIPLSRWRRFTNCVESNISEDVI